MKPTRFNHRNHPTTAELESLYGQLIVNFEAISMELAHLGLAKIACIAPAPVSEKAPVEQGQAPVEQGKAPVEQVCQGKRTVQVSGFYLEIQTLLAEFNVPMRKFIDGL